MCTKGNYKRMNHAFRLFCLMLCMAVVFGMAGIPTQATENGNAFFIEAELVDMNEDTYDIQVTIENPGKDWEGMVRVMVDETYDMSTAYDVKLSLPEGSEKQFIVKVSRAEIEQTNGTVYVYMLDKKEKIVWEENFYHLLTNGQMSIHMGILSDDYSSLTFLDMNGNKMYFWGDDYPIKLYEITQANLLDKLDNMQYLVIDDFDTAVLTEEELASISTWCDDGGMLIVGTGEYAKETLGSLTHSFVDIECYEVNEPGSKRQYYQYNDMVDWSVMYMADLMEGAPDNFYNVMYTSAVMCYSQGDGVIAVAPYSLKELGLQNSAFYQDSYLNRVEFVRELLQDVANMSMSKYQDPYLGKQYNVMDNISTVLRAIGSANSKLDFNILRWIILLYVVFVGPVLYLILKSIKKRDYYWGAVAVTVVATVFLVFLAGRGHEVKNTRVFSVTTENVQDAGKSKAYLYAYNANHDEWSMKLREGYEFAGKMGYRNYWYGDSESDYDCRVIQEGDRLSVGIVPSENFEDAYFVLGCAKEAQGIGGNLSGQDVYEDLGRLYGTITNDTTADFAYYAVIVNENIFLMENWKAGETIDLQSQKVLYHNTDGSGYFGRYQNSYLRNEYRDGKRTPEEISALAAIGVGMYNACLEYDGAGVIIIGVTEDEQGTVEDKVSESSYRCVYRVLR
ncbi:MAG: hypothetical protein IKK33_09055 [Lachnospiraceae bacterium]|nr:hypothetical protein [Lachnospiraceae bacterium]